MAKKSKRMGRPPKPERERKKRNFTFRETDEFHRLIAASAKADNRKIGEQIVLLCREALQNRRQKVDIRTTAVATANAALERFVGFFQGGKPQVFEVDYTKDPDGDMRLVSPDEPPGDTIAAIIRSALAPQVVPRSVEFLEAYRAAADAVMAKFKRGEITRDEALTELHEIAEDLERKERVIQSSLELMRKTTSSAKKRGTK